MYPCGHWLHYQLARYYTYHNKSLKWATHNTSYLFVWQLWLNLTVTWLKAIRVMLLYSMWVCGAPAWTCNEDEEEKTWSCDQFHKKICQKEKKCVCVSCRERGYHSRRLVQCSLLVFILKLHSHNADKMYWFWINLLQGSNIIFQRVSTTSHAALAWASPICTGDSLGKVGIPPLPRLECASAIHIMFCNLHALNLRHCVQCTLLFKTV